MRVKKTFSVDDIATFKSSLLEWSQQFTETVWLDSNGHTNSYSSFDDMLAVDAFTSMVTDEQHGFDKLAEYQATIKDWIFGYLSYDLKNDVEALSSNNHDGLDFPDLYFFQPKKIIKIQGNTIEFLYLHFVDDEIDEDFQCIQSSLCVEELLPAKAKIFAILYVFLITC